MGLRKPAVLSKMKRARRKHLEGKIDAAELLATVAGKRIGKMESCNALEIVSAMKGTPATLISLAQAAMHDTSTRTTTRSKKLRV